MKTGIIFDMDGTLWDSSENVAKSWTEVFEKHPNPWRAVTTGADVRSVMGLTMTEIGIRMFPDMDPAEREVLMQEALDYENIYLAAHGGELYPELAAALKRLREDGWPLYIVSNCQNGYIEAFLDYFHFREYFDDFMCFGDTKAPKHVTMRALADRNHLDEFYYVGDIQGDYDSTVKAGGKFIHAAYGFGTIDTEVPELAAFRDLPELMKELTK